MGAALILDYRFWRKVSWILYLGNAVLLALLLVAGRARSGAESWLSAGGVSLQPSEFAKLLFLVTFADFLTRNRNEIGSPPVLAQAMLHFLAPFGLVALQPDLGTASVFAAMFFAMLFVSGIDLLKFAAIAVGTVSTALVAAPLALHDYQLTRLLSFLDPWKDPLGAGYQQIQSKIAIGSGGWTGQGLFHGLQGPLGFLPAAWTDFIFAVLGEETGSAGCTVVLALFSAVLYRIYRVGRESGDPFARQLAAGVMAMIGFQTAVSVGMSLGLLPITGIPLPFISYGGSSLATNFLSIGLILNISMRKKALIFR